MFGQIVDKSCEVGHSAGLHFTDRKMHREGRPILALASHDASNADDMPLAGGQITGQISVMARTIRIGHQDADVLADCLLFGIAELSLRGATKELYDAASIDDDHRVGDRLQYRTEVAFFCSERLFDLLLFVDIDHEPAEMTGRPLLVPYDAATCANPSVYR